MALVEYAKKELALLRTPGEVDEMQDLVEANILKMVEVFAEAGHSGFSAGYTIGILEKLLRFEPLKPLTGEDDEWMEVGEGQFQNIRCGRVFKNADGSAYDIDGKVFTDPDGCSYTNSDSRVPVTFPYTPVTEYVQVPAETSSE